MKKLIPLLIFAFLFSCSSAEKKVVKKEKTPAKTIATLPDKKVDLKIWEMKKGWTLENDRGDVFARLGNLIFAVKPLPAKKMFAWKFCYSYKSEGWYPYNNEQPLKIEFYNSKKELLGSYIFSIKIYCNSEVKKEVLFGFMKYPQFRFDEISYIKFAWRTDWQWEKCREI